MFIFACNFHLLQIVEGTNGPVFPYKVTICLSDVLPYRFTLFIKLPLFTEMSKG